MADLYDAHDRTCEELAAAREDLCAAHERIRELEKELGELRKEMSLKTDPNNPELPLHQRYGF